VKGPYLSACCKTVYFLGTNIFRTSDFLKNRYLAQTNTYKSQFISFFFFRYQRKVSRCTYCYLFLVCLKINSLHESCNINLILMTKNFVNIAKFMVLEMCALLANFSNEYKVNTLIFKINDLVRILQ